MTSNDSFGLEKLPTVKLSSSLPLTSNSTCVYMKNMQASSTLRAAG